MFGGSTPDHHPVAGGGQSSGKWTGEVASAEDADNLGVKLRHANLKRPAPALIVSSLD